MAKLPNNYVEILTYLRASQPDGMTTTQILDKAKKNRYFEFTNSTKVSSVIFYMRAKKLLTSIDQPGGRIHHITAYGMSQLADEIGPTSTQPVSLQTEPIDEIIRDIQDGADETQAAELPAPALPGTAQQKARDLLEEFDEHFQIVRTALIEELAEIKTPRIENKDIKIALLRRFEDFFNDETNNVIAAIRGDLEQMGDV